MVLVGGFAVNLKFAPPTLGVCLSACFAASPARSGRPPPIGDPSEPCLECLSMFLLPLPGALVQSRNEAVRGAHKDPKRGGKPFATDYPLAHKVVKTVLHSLEVVLCAAM
jgi:hypothetical protein